MKPLRLSMRAFGSYGDEVRIDFTKSSQKLFLITGDTGAGKTTVFDAIVFALYGEASSGSNKKDGTVLQSQYVAYDVTPFVKLEFSDGEGGDVYTVTRIPRHVKLITRGKDKGLRTREENASVSLILPDKTEYPVKETDQKIEEIVGLTKEQFMQVAMIAQGEFMELLRAKSDVRKVIFRKLFHTDFYQRIALELEERKRQKEKEIDEIKAGCKSMVHRVNIPEDYERAEEVMLLKKQVESGVLANLEAFLSELRLLYKNCEETRREGEKAYQAASAVRDERRDMYTAAESLLVLYEQLEQAEADLEECGKRKKEMDEKRYLAEGLQAAFEILAEYRAYEGAARAVRKLKQEKQDQEEILPQLRENAARLRGEEEKEGERFDAAQEKYNKLSQKVEDARCVLTKIAATEKAYQNSRKNLEETEKEEQSRKDKLAALNEQEREQRAQAEKLSDAEKLLENQKLREKEAEDLSEAAGEIKELEMQIGELAEKAGEAQAAYEAAKEAYLLENAVYEQKRQSFLDAQAGIFASRLEEGKPCPICGSLEHPAPYQGGEGDRGISGEEMETLGRAVQELREKQEEAAGCAREVETTLRERKALYERKTGKLAEDYREALQNAGVKILYESMEDFLDAVRAEGVLLREKAESLKSIRHKLEEAAEEKEKLRQSIEEITRKVRAAEIALHQEKATLESLSKTTEFAGIEEAESLLRKERQRRDAVKSLYEKAKQETKRAEDLVKEGETLLRNYRAQLPEKEAEEREKREAYLLVMEQKDRSEAEWKKLTADHSREDIDILRQEITDYERKKQTALGIKEAAGKAVEGKEKPDLAKLGAEKEEAEEKLVGIKESLMFLAGREQDNRRVYEELLPGAEKRKEIIKQHERLESLYKLISGNVSGARMDLETFVQRYYLEKILSAANRRFHRMTAGQFELRMMPAQRAGEGKNRGLDLMVYSTVTGKEREIRTLSGGESFMAALSLALGMSDQIQENTSSIHLDIMFIDEGFGSLDEHSRYQAVKVLKEMAEGEKMIGIISHVPELKQEIEDRLLVYKTDRGSMAKWENRPDE